MKVNITPDTVSLELSQTELQGLAIMAGYAKLIGDCDQNIVDSANMLIEELGKIKKAMEELNK